VVDASLFPRIPGLFIACAVYMVGEKAADAIVADAQRTCPEPLRAEKTGGRWNARKCRPISRTDHMAVL
jgi:choline dehydrogenase-like flavoprotein